MISPITKRFAVLSFMLGVAFCGAARRARGGDLVQSPDGRLTVEVTLGPDGAPAYTVQSGGKPVLLSSQLGLTRQDEDFSRDLVSRGVSTVVPVEDRYEILTAKRRLNLYRANRRVFQFAAKSGHLLNIVFQVSNDGVAFRYVFPETSPSVYRLKEEATSFRFAPDAKAWLQPMSMAKTGYEGSNPAYEEFYTKEIPVGTASTLGAGWVFPALFRTGETWVLLSEGTLARTDCASRLRHESTDGEYRIGLPDPRETINGQPVNSASSLPWQTPWRLIVVGPLQTIVESTLGLDLATPAKGALDPRIKPGKAAWSWPLLGDSSANNDTQRRFIDYAAEMGWGYCLIDAWWDRQIGYDKMKQLADYAASKKVGLLLWYCSSGNWNTIKQTPRDKLLTHEKRVQEFDRLRSMGIKGLKVDFFGGDGQPNIAYYHDLLADAAPYGFLINFHGATLPRGLQRTYPNLVTTEAIRGEEFITFNQADADQEPTHAAMLPFARNVFDPMDFTPMCLDHLPRTQRRTTSGFELALSVIFTSGVQHYAETPDGMAKMPAYVRDYLKKVPSVWEDTKFIDGYPGKFVVLARRGEGRWYIAGINGEDREKALTLNLKTLGANDGVWLIQDGAGDEEHLFEGKSVSASSDGKVTVTMKPHGGFVLVAGTLR